MRTVPAAADIPSEERELRGAPDVLADELIRYVDLGLAHVQVQLRPNNVEGVRAAGPIIEALRDRLAGGAPTGPG